MQEIDTEQICAVNQKTTDFVAFYVLQLNDH